MRHGFPMALLRHSLSFLILTAISATNSFAAKVHASNAWDVATLDRLLAEVPPGQQTIQLGDMEILVGNARAWRNQLAGEPIAPSAFDGSIPTWPDGKVYYEFDATVSALKQRAFLDASGEWATFARLAFIKKEAQANYVLISEDSTLPGGNAGVGMIGGMQRVRIGPNAWNRRTLCHEIGHALGLIHEHQRSDRDSFITVFTNNFEAAAAGNFVKFGNSRNSGAYDFLSVMHYSRNDLSKNPATLNTLEPLPAFAGFLNVFGAPHELVLSAGDRAGIAAVYGPGLALGSVVTTTADSGPGSLRAALYFAADNPGATITFNIPANDPGLSGGIFTIQLTDELPALGNRTTIDASLTGKATSAAGTIRLAGFMPPVAGTFPTGLRFHGTNSVATGLSISGFAGNGVAIEDGAAGNQFGGPGAAERNVVVGNGQHGIIISGLDTFTNTIAGNFIGVGADGNTAQPNRFDGVSLQDSTRGNTIANNVISGNGANGISINASRENVARGNKIGINAAGDTAISNAWSGVFISDRSQSNIIGGFTAEDRNVISGNGNYGLVIQGIIAWSNLLVGNYIGTDFSGERPVPNGWSGVAINGASNNRVGGPEKGARNVISGNMLQGVSITGGETFGTYVTFNWIGLTARGTSALPNQLDGIAIFSGANNSAIWKNVISGNGRSGLLLADAGTKENQISGNYIGADPSGTKAIGNIGAGIVLTGANHTRIGGHFDAGNVVSGNGQQGILITGLGADENSVYGNFIGLDVTGILAIPNQWPGLEISGGAKSNRVGDFGYDRNIISGNGHHGVSITGTSTSGNSLQGNIIGLNVLDLAVSNRYAGVSVSSGASSNVIGSLGLVGNVISGNGNQGVVLSGAGVSGNVVFGNFIGLNTNATVARPNLWPGVEISNGARGNLIGVTQGNHISGNAHYGLVIYGAGADQNIVQGNTIGLNFNGEFVGNRFPGIAIASGAQSNLIGGDSVWLGNVVAGNQSDGMQLTDATTLGNTVRGNSLYGNKGTGLALFKGANNSTPTPTLAGASVGSNWMVAGTLAAAPNVKYQIDFYGSPGPTSLAEGMDYLGAIQIKTASDGTASFSANLPFTLSGNIITATATDAAGNTSRMSAGIGVSIFSAKSDGVPSGWRALYFGGDGSTTNSQSCGACDPDKDGASNAHEFLAGTNPVNEHSVFKLDLEIDHSLRASVFSFNLQAGALYQIEARVASDTGNWSMIANQIIGTKYGYFRFSDPDFGTGAMKFYRVTLLR